ncbi:cation:proton antiporter [Ideonella sp.]|uniref:cation:proton antiporter n=1 Tax=Ideonella sp. TaxID=1929293 RepID=UPI002B47126F|nr:cation:proton antiporter [Ideonella sp.]HJV71339.1 cation:proton antiporter [Ideonella sp.]
MATRWFVVVGLLLILIGLTDTWRRELPVTAAAIYLIAGHLLGPEFAGFIDLGLARDAVLLEHLAEVALLISLFAVGLRLRAPLADPIWRTPLVMATATMLASVALLCAAGLTLGLAIGPALLLGAALAPTDPVLASDVQVDHERDRDRLRFSLSAEAGLNDGTALPMVLLALGLMGLHELGAGGWRWGLVDLLWGAAGGLSVGWALGFAFSRLVVWLRREREQALGMESFLTLGLIALTYGLALLLQVGGFLAVFAAGLAMRQVERRELPAEDAAYMARAVLDFTLDLEKLAELVVMIVVGALLTREAFTAQTIGAALVVFFVVRPLAVYATTWRLTLGRSQRGLAAWFGIRGVGSMYYLAFAAAHGAGGPQLGWVADAVLVTITLSVLLHGTSATPVMRSYRRSRSRRRPPAG